MNFYDWMDKLDEGVEPMKEKILRWVVENCDKHIAVVIAILIVCLFILLGRRYSKEIDCRLDEAAKEALRDD